MRAWVYSRRGAPGDVLSLASVAEPELPASPGEEWIRVRVAYAGLNIGAVITMGLVPAWLRAATCVADMDLAGVVEAVAPEDATARFRAGDKVVVMIPAGHGLKTGAGALGERVAVPARFAVRKPAGVPFADAAGALVAGLTAAQLVDRAGVRPGARVLVVAASGGIGTLALQMVRRAAGPGGVVVGVCSGPNAAAVRGLGADDVVDYTEHGAGLAAHLAARFGAAPFDAVVDALGVQAVYTGCAPFLARGGVYASAGVRAASPAPAAVLAAALRLALNPVLPAWLGGGPAGRAWRAAAMLAPTLAERQRVVDMVAAGDVRLVRDSVWAFDDVVAAYAKVAGQRVCGKVVVRVDGGVSAEAC